MSNFTWRVSTSGYEWVPVHVIVGLKRAGPVFNGEGLATRYADHRDSRPMDDPTLFLKFADLGAGREAYLGFANGHGHLTGRVCVTDTSGKRQSAGASPLLRVNDEPDPVSSRAWQEPPYQVETLDLWRAEVAAMKAAVQVLRHHTGKAARPPAGLYEQVRGNLRHRVELGFDDSGVPVIEPTDLLSALWLQLAHALGGSGGFRQCGHCTKWFIVSDRGPAANRAARSDKTYCGDSCRQAAAYARRKAEAPSEKRNTAPVSRGRGKPA